jgi:Fic family protein
MDKRLCPLQEKAAREIENQAHVVEYLEDFVKKGRRRITESDLLEIHRITIDGIYPCVGKFRDARTQIAISGSAHQPSHSAQVRSDVWDLLYWLYEGEGSACTPLRRSAHVLWKINAIHPFNGGNGRVARAVAYLITLLEVAPVFAGEPLPTKLKIRKQNYLDALEAADRGSLSRLEELVLLCFREQLQDIASGTQLP